MHNPSGGFGHYSADQHGAYAGYQSGGLGDLDERPIGWYLSIVVTVLGVGVYLASYALNFHGTGVGWPVRFAVLAALVAGLGLAPRQPGHPTFVVVLAAAGFLEALSTRIMAPELAPSGLALTVITVLGGLQAAVAVAVLFFGGADGHSGAGGYDAYAEYYARAVADYYAHYEQQGHEPPPVSGAVATAEQVGRAQATAPGAAGAIGNPYVDYVGTSAPGQSSAAPAPAAQASAAGLPAFGQSPHAVQPGQARVAGEQRSTPQQ